MFKPIVRLTFGEEVFDVVKLMASEVAKVQSWTGLSSKSSWFEALGQEDIDAFRAGYTLMKQRAGEDIRFSDVDFDTDDMRADFVDPATGRPVEPILELDDEGDPKLNSKGTPIAVKDKAGHPTWKFTDDGSPVPPPTEA